MLVELSVENFRSFRDSTTISFLASSDKSLIANTTEIEGMKDTRVVNSAIIYGPNASGKSNIVMALAFIRNFVINSHTHQKGMKLNHQPFAFDPKCLDKPTNLAISFIHKNILYEFKFSYNKDRILEESLFHYPNGKKATIYTRDENGFEFTKDKKEQEIISKRTLENVLYLSTSVQFNYQSTLPAYDWFFNELIILDTTLNQDSLMEYTIEKMNHDKKTRGLVTEAMKIADLGIIGIEGKIKEIPMKDLHGKLPPQLIGVMSLTGSDSVKSNDLKFKHNIKDRSGSSKTISLNYIQESEGTRRLFSILGPILESLTTGKTLVVDEFDTKLHHLISHWLISLYHDPDQNTKGSQLIFNTHDLLLLDQEIFRRDQIWFTEKGTDDGASILISMAEFSERKDRDILKAYVMGRYGAKPSISSKKVV